MSAGPGEAAGCQQKRTGKCAEAHRHLSVCLSRENRLRESRESIYLCVFVCVSLISIFFAEVNSVKQLLSVRKSDCLFSLLYSSLGYLQQVDQAEFAVVLMCTAAPIKLSMLLRQFLLEVEVSYFSQYTSKRLQNL